MKYHQMRGDMIMVYKELNGYNPSLDNLFAVDNNSITRGHNFKLKKPPFITTIYQHFSSNRVVNNWNSRSFDVINAVPLTVLKISLINVGKIGCMSRGKYKETICFSPVFFICFSSLFFPKRLLSNLRTFYLCPVWVYLRGRFGTLFTPGVEHFCGDILSSTAIAESSFLGVQQGDKCSSVVQCYFLGVTMK